MIIVYSTPKSETRKRRKGEKDSEWKNVQSSGLGQKFLEQAFLKYIGNRGLIIPSLHKSRTIPNRIDRKYHPNSTLFNFIATILKYVKMIVSR